jgi:hypothetical protein
LAKKVGVDRKLVRAILAGGRALTVDAAADLLGALNPTPEELQVLSQVFLAAEAAKSDASAPDDEPAIRTVPDVAVEAVLPADFKIDPYGNHTEQILRIGFALGVDVHFLARIDLLEDSGVPAVVLEQYSDYLPIRLDAAIHTYVKPRFFPDGVQLVLSFDVLRTCLFPWASVEQVTLVPAALDPEEPDPDPTEETVRGPHLRLVKS